ncbi:MAG: FHA domain-containing protein [Woeseia sp.]|nr:FHA domain-containing protein [Woeseia sp.]MBT8096903.1 FHA domain-containing protein [Woeseia sp.]NNE62294.1 FHA domain-containing protein [Woeseia sp.]NNL55161.1 FHA domain-containing protein [Woeseia sp.]
MARLILSLDSQVLAEYNMSKERYTIGRLPDNDVRIDNPAVSGHHSLIINILNDSFLEDLNSTNGTYVNGKLVKKHALQHGDVITIGHHQLRFSDQQASEPDQDEFEKTMVIPASKQNQEQLQQAHEAAEAAMANQNEVSPPTERLDLNKVDLPEAKAKPHGATSAGLDPADAPVALPLGKLQVLSGSFAGRELELTKALTTLGRPGVQVAAITRRADGYFVVHVESGKTGDFPLINGEPIGAQARRLKENDVLQLAGIKMGFFSA